MAIHEKTQQMNMLEHDKPEVDFEAPVVPHESPAVQEDVVSTAPLEEILTEESLQAFEKAVDLHKRMLTAIFKLTTPAHWIKMGPESYYLQGPGVESIMKPLGISYQKPSITKEMKEDKDGPYYIYMVEGIIESRRLGQYGWFIGTCNSRDQFFKSNRSWSPETGEGDILKSAMMNWVVNGVTRLAGIRKPDPEMLKAAGINLDRIQEVNYSGAKTGEQTGKFISEPQAKRLWAISRTAKVDSELLKAFVKEVYNAPNTEQIPIGQYEAIVTAVEKGPNNLRERVEQVQAKRKSEGEPPSSDEREPGAEG